MQIIFAHSAFTDLEHIVEYYRADAAPPIGQRFVTEIIAHIQVLADHPDAGRIVPEFQLQHIREIIHPPFRVVYLREEKSIQVIRIWRSERLLMLDTDI